MTDRTDRIANPDLTVGDGNKQRWNRPAHRRHGFHNAHRLFRRALMLRARHHLVLTPAENAGLAALPEVAALTGRPEFSALVCVRGQDILLSRHAPDFPTDQPHSIQSVTKLFMHLIAGKLIGDGLLDPAQHVETYLPAIGSGYRGATVQNVLDMNVVNDFVEDYCDPNADSYTEEVALGWRLPPDGVAETTMHDFVTSVSGGDLVNREDTINYCSANTDLLTLICDALAPGRLAEMIGAIVDAAGIEGTFHVSLSPDGLPAFSGGGCLSATDLARFGLFLARIASDDHMAGWNQSFTRGARSRPAKTLLPPRGHIRYANQMMTDGRWIGHAGYGGQFLMVDTSTGFVSAYLSVLENDSGYCEDYMAQTIQWLEEVSDFMRR